MDLPCPGKMQNGPGCIEWVRYMNSLLLSEPFDEFAMIKIWLQVWGKKHAHIKNEVWNALKKTGFSPSELDQDEECDHGVILFDKVTPALRGHLHDLSRNGLVRILALAVSPERMPAEDVWSLMNAGASDVIAWGPDGDSANVISARISRWAAVDRLMETSQVRNTLVGQSPAWISMLRQVVEVARFTDAAVLITGETGTGKELVARLIHNLDNRPSKRELVVLDCTTIMPSLSGSEFFGHERGSFTGAHAQREGAFARADGGTLFLDEIAELPLDLQAQLLRVVQEGTYRRVGGNAWHETQFRLVCATHRDFNEQLARGRFRHDFYYRIANWTCKLPPLRERPEDILLLARHFMKVASPGGQPPDMDENVCAYLVQRDYPGNVRDLKRLVLGMMHHHVGNGPITVGDIPQQERFMAGNVFTDWRSTCFEKAIRQALHEGLGLKAIGRAAEDVAIRQALDNSDGNLRRAAGKLSVTERALQIRRASRKKSDES